jgi:hypothetical protein
MQCFFARCAAEIKDDRTLITIEGGKIPAQPFDHHPLRTQRITSGRLDLDDLSAHVCQ